MLEIGIALSALLVEAGFAGAVPLYLFLYHRLGPEQYLALHAVRFFVSGLLLLLPTACMGATLPVLVEHGVRRDARFGNVAGTFYGVNTIGAAAGTALAGFLLLPRLGRPGTLAVAALANLTLGALALLLRRRLEAAPAGEASAAGAPVAETAPPPGASMSPALRGLVLATVAVSGFAAMTYQIGWTRVLLVQIGSSIYAFTSVLVVFIVGLGLGAFVIGLAADRIRRPVFALGLAQLGLGLAALWILPHFASLAPEVVRWLRESGETGRGLLAHGFLFILRELFVPTFLLGMTFPLVVFAVTRMHREASRTVGLAYAVNTVGTILGSVIAGFLLLAGPPGVVGTLVIAIVLSAGLGVPLLLADRGVRLPARLAVLAGFLLLFLFRAEAARENPLDRATLTAGAFLGSTGDTGSILYYRDGADATVSIHEPPYGGRTLRINGKADASTGLADMPTQVALAQVPILLAPDPKKVLVVGLGGGVTMASAATHEGVERIDVLEISGEVIEGARLHFGPYTHGAFDDPRVRIIRNDGRNHLLLSRERYDVIISEPSNPWLAGIANLFTEEYFMLARARLEPGGVYCQWLQAYGMAPSDFLLVIRTLAHVFPNVTLWQAQFNDFLLIAGDDRPPVALGDLATRMLEPRVFADLESIGLEHPGRFLGGCLADDATLRSWAGEGPLNTDGNGILEFSAPLQRLRHESPSLMASLARHARGNSGRLVEADTENPDHAAVLSLASRNRAGTLGIYEATQSAPDPATLLASASKLFRADPGDWRIYRMVQSATDILERELASRPGSSPEIALFVDRVRASGKPPSGPLTTDEEKRLLAGSWLAEAEAARARGHTIDARVLEARASLFAGVGAPGAPSPEPGENVRAAGPSR
ncbi:MAG: hypothetical protein EHM19_07200 [Candidatus Latescibacterota bacterium]|nr:MAG: hypothetical protein EHM19_07200 [Candidatus Latescibacterota bacterium]